MFVPVPFWHSAGPPAASIHPLHAPTREGLIQTVFSTANAAIVDEATAFPEDNDTFTKHLFLHTKSPLYQS